MWQRFPNMFPPPSTPHPTASLAFSSLCQAAKSEGYEMGVMGRLYDCHVWGVCKPTLTHTYTQCMCVCVCAFIIRLLMSRKTLRAAQAERATCNVAASRTFEANLMPFFLQPAMMHLSKWVECSQKWSEVAFFWGRACVCAPTLHQGKPSRGKHGKPRPHLLVCAFYAACMLCAQLPSHVCL